jgi:hypothetical protein
MFRHVPWTENSCPFAELGHSLTAVALAGVEALTGQFYFAVATVGFASVIVTKTNKVDQADPR